MEKMIGFSSTESSVYKMYIMKGSNMNLHCLVVQNDYINYLPDNRELVSL